MSLDAVVYCNCFELGRLRTPPDPAWRVYVDPSGARSPGTGELALQMAFDRWNAHACEHDDGVLIHHWLGNIAAIAAIRGGLALYADRFPLILSRVVQNGVHTGDDLPPARFPELAAELDALSSTHATDTLTEEWLRRFERQMRELVTTAQSLGRPISF